MTGKRNTINQAYWRYVTAMQAAVGCITQRRFLGVRGNFKLNEPYSINLNQGDPVTLTTPHGRIAFSAGQLFRLILDDEAEAGPYRATTVSYWYQFEVDDHVEIIVFHWTPEAEENGARRYPHIHIGPGLLRSSGSFMDGTFHKAHIPTSRVSLEAVVRFAIEELEVRPIKQDWQTILDNGERRFRRHSRKG